MAPAWSASTTMSQAETLRQTTPGARTKGRPAGDGLLLPGRVGRYEILDLVGEGAMGRVYRGRDPRDGRPVAIKVIKEPHCHDTQAMKRFVREAEAVSRLSHPGLVAVHDTGPSFIVLELLEGESLAALFARKGALRPEEAVPVLRGVAEVLEYIHARGVVHRDVKPSNIMVLPSGGVKLTDFGVAHLSWAPMTRTGELLGSPAYMAPEQITLGDVEPVSDQHALAVVAWEALVGRRPFEGRTLGALLMKVTTEAPPSAHAAQASLPPGIDVVFRQALAKDPDERFPSASAFVDALAAALRAPRPSRIVPLLAAFLLPALALVRGS